MNGFLDWLFGDGGKAALAGSLGGVVRWLSLRETWQDGLISITVGGICAVYLSPLVVLWLVPQPATNTAFASLAAFVTGIGGIGVVGFVMDMWKAWRKRGPPV